jgi:DNA-binding NarL/FixJ family response regulator
MVDQLTHSSDVQDASVQSTIYSIRILLADDHALLRQGTAELLRREPDLQVVGEAGDGQRAVELAEKLKPDLVIMDVRMPVLSGIEATRRIRQSVPSIRVLVLTAHDDLQYVFSLLQAGASGYLLKTAPISDLVSAIHRIYAGDMSVDPAIACKIVLQQATARNATLLAPAGVVSGSSPVSEPIILEELTEREMTILQLLARGLSNQAIAESLSISDRTVQSHLTRLFSKMSVSSRLEAVLAGIRLGWLTLEG